MSRGHIHAESVIQSHKHTLHQAGKIRSRCISSTLGFVQAVVVVEKGESSNNQPHNSSGDEAVKHS